MKKIIVIVLASFFLNSCFILKEAVYHSFNTNLNMPIAHFNVYDINDSLINTSIYKGNVVIISFCRLNKFTPNDFASFNQVINHFSAFSDIKFVNIATEMDRDTWLKILSENEFKGDNYLCKDSQYKIYDFYDENDYNTTIIYNKEEKIMGYDLMEVGVVYGPFYVLKDISVVEGIRTLNKKSKWDDYTKYVASELNKTINDSSYVFNPNFYIVE